LEEPQSSIRAFGGHLPGFIEVGRLARASSVGQASAVSKKPISIIFFVMGDHWMKPQNREKRV
jgi:hypothetical protein